MTHNGPAREHLSDIAARCVATRFYLVIAAGYYRDMNLMLHHESMALFLAQHD